MSIYTEYYHDLQQVIFAENRLANVIRWSKMENLAEGAGEALKQSIKEYTNTLNRLKKAFNSKYPS